MANIVTFLGKIYELLNMKMNIYGFMFSFWDIIMFTLIGGVVIGFVRYLFYEN